MEAAHHPWPALGVLLLRDGLVTKDQLNAVLDGQSDTRQQRITGSRLGEILIESGVVSAVQVARLLAEQYELPFMELAPADVGVHAARAFTVDQAYRFSAVPINRRPDGSYDLAIADPSTVVFSDELRGILDATPHFVVVGNDAIAAAIAEAFSNPDVVVDDGAGDTSSVVALGPSDDTQDVFPRSGTLAQLWPPLGALLVRDGLVSDGELQAALAQQRLSTSQRLGEILVERGVVSPTIVARLVAEQYELPFASLDELDVDASIARLLPEAIARRYRAVPIGRSEDGSVEVAIADPTSIFYSDELHTELDAPLKLVVAPPDEIDALLARTYDSVEVDQSPEPAVSDPAPTGGDRDEGLVADEGEMADLSSLPAREHELVVEQTDAHPEREEHDDVALGTWATEPLEVGFAATRGAPFEVAEPELTQDDVEAEADLADIIRLDTPATSTDLAEAMHHAVESGASTIHLSHHDGTVDVRARVAGTLETVGSYPAHELPSVLGFFTGSEKYEVNTLPTTRGTKITVSIVERDVAPASLAELGLTADAERSLRAALAQTGLVVVTGPPASGVTSTLHAALDALVTSDRVAATVEDHITRVFDGVDQTQIDESLGITFADALRQLWSMDVDVALVSALADGDAAATALRGALAGRHVVAGMRESDAASATVTLFELAGSTDRLAAALTCVVSQRLVARICDDCRETYYASPSELAMLGLEANDGQRLLARGRGCRTCTGRGSRGRTAVFEVLTMTDGIRQLVRDGATTTEIRAAARAAGAPTVDDEIVRLCLEGLATTAELERLSESSR